jgi:hypothetical protein
MHIACARGKLCAHFLSVQSRACSCVFALVYTCASARARVCYHKCFFHVGSHVRIRVHAQTRASFAELVRSALSVLVAETPICNAFMKLGTMDDSMLGRSQRHCEQLSTHGS